MTLFLYCRLSVAWCILLSDVLPAEEQTRHKSSCAKRELDVLQIISDVQLIRRRAQIMEVWRRGQGTYENVNNRLVVSQQHP